MQKNSPFTWFLYWKLPTDTDFIHFICQFHQYCGINARECFHGPVAPEQGMLGALIVWWPASFWLLWTMAEGTAHAGSPANFPTKPTEEWKKGKMYAIKQIKICAEYRDMLPRPRLDLSGTPGLRPFGLSPGSWQTSLGLGSMSRYSAQILICITNYGCNISNQTIGEVEVEVTENSKQVQFQFTPEVFDISHDIASMQSFMLTSYQCICMCTPSFISKIMRRMRKMTNLFHDFWPAIGYGTTDHSYGMWASLKNKIQSRHYCDVIMSAMAPQNTGVSIAC